MTFAEAWKLKMVVPGKAVYGLLKEDVTMRVWNQRHPVDENVTFHLARAGTKVRIWAVSRFGFIGVTDNLVDPVGYDAGVDPEVVDLIDPEGVAQ